VISTAQGTEQHRSRERSGVGARYHRPACRARSAWRGAVRPAPQIAGLPLVTW